MGGPLDRSGFAFFYNENVFFKCALYRSEVLAFHETVHLMFFHEKADRPIRYFSEPVIEAEENRFEVR